MPTPPLPDPDGRPAIPIDPPVPALADDGDDLDADLDPREAARTRRRDHDADAERRDLLRPGMGKVFKQIIDAWAEKASAAPDRARNGAGRGDHRRR